MTNTTYKNEIAKRKFIDYLIHSKGFSPKTIEAFEKAIWLWEDFTKNADLKSFTKVKAEQFKIWLKNKDKADNSGKVGLSYCYDNLRHLKKFFDWLSKQKGYKTITATDIDYLNLSKADNRIATQSRGQASPTIDQIKSVIEAIPGKNEIEMRDKALLSLIYLTGARISATLSLPMQSFDKENLLVYQDPKFGVKTKFSKRFVSPLVPFPYNEPISYFIAWYDYLKDKKNFQQTDPIFPATKIGSSPENLGFFSTEEVEPVFWKSNSSALKIFQKRFKQAGIPYYHPHTFRHTLVKEISKLPLTEEQKKAISQSLGHEDVGTTFGNYGYGQIEENRQIDLVKNIDFTGKKQQEIRYSLGEEDLERLANKLKNSS